RGTQSVAPQSRPLWSAARRPTSRSWGRSPASRTRIRLPQTKGSAETPTASLREADTTHRPIIRPERWRCWPLFRHRRGVTDHRGLENEFDPASWRVIDCNHSGTHPPTHFNGTGVFVDPGEQRPDPRFSRCDHLAQGVFKQPSGFVPNFRTLEGAEEFQD